MPSQLFIFPGFFDREIDLTTTQVEPSGVPAGVIGAAERGPAFVPYTVGSFADFRNRFGGLDPDKPAPYAAQAFLENRPSLSFIRVLGGGANQTAEDIERTRETGIVKNAGVHIEYGLIAPGYPEYGSSGKVMFIVARHKVTSNEAIGMPTFSNNDTYFTSGASDEVNLVRGMILIGNKSIITASSDQISSTGTVPIMCGTIVNGSYGVNVKNFSFDPSRDDYLGNVLNTDPSKFEDTGHLLLADWPVDAGLAYVVSESYDCFAFMSGSDNTSATSGDTSMTIFDAYGHFDTRYTTPTTTWFISQPYGTTEYDLFRIESLDDGQFANDKYKISISQLQKSSNPRYDYGTFSVVVRDFYDTDVEPKILEQFNNLTLDPESENYIAKVIGDKKAYFNFDVENEDDRRIVVDGKYPNRSKLIRVVMSSEIDNATGNIPKTAIPFGFRGQPTINTNPWLIDAISPGVSGAFLSGGFGDVRRLTTEWDTITNGNGRLFGSVVPPVPMRFKITRGTISTTSSFIGNPGPTEVVDGRYYWGVKFERTDNVLNPNVSTRPNRFIASNNKFLGLAKLDVMLTGSACDTFNNNKFSLARVALSNTDVAQVTASATTHMREAAYIRNGIPDPTNYTILDNATDRITLASLFHKGSTSAVFNRFSEFAKFTTTMFGGYDGVNFLDKNSSNLNDRASSSETSGSVIGNAASTFTSPLFNKSMDGAGINNNTVVAYRTAARIITDPVKSNINLLATPGQRDPLVTDYVADRVKDFGVALYLQDVPQYDVNNDRVFDGVIGQNVDNENTADRLEARAIDNEAVASYYPGIVIDDSDNNRKVTVPGTVASLAAISFNDRVAYPWFAPAGFNRASLSFVTRTQTRVNQNDRERLVSVNLNPIVKFPSEGYVIFSQKTMKQEESALKSINVQRMLSDVKRQVIEIGNKVLWDNIDQTIYEDLTKNITNALSVVQTRQGIDRFQVICDARNNTSLDRDNNTINVRIRLVPTRSIEFVTLDFIITRSGVAFA